MTFLEKRKEQMYKEHGIGKSAGEKLKEGSKPMNVPELLVQGPKELDCNVRKWQLGDSIGVIGSSGVGKTSFIMWTFKHLLLNNPEGICIIVACEMSESQLLAKWQKATQDCPEISDRLYIITAFDDKNNTRDLSMDGIKKLLKLHQDVLNVKILSYVIDHLHIIKRGENETLNDVIVKFKMTNMELNTLGFLTSQTTKGKSGCGDIPLDKTACYGTSAFEWEMTQIYTICQPLKRVEETCKMPITSWQLAKNRFKEKDDRVKESTNYLLYFNHEDESYRALNGGEMKIFKEMYSAVLEIRKNEEKTGEHIFDTSYTVTKKDGSVMKLYGEKGRQGF